MRDITEEKSLERATARHAQELERGRRALLSVLEDERRAQESSRRLALAVEQSPESIVITDVAGNIEYVNAAFEVRTGYPREAVIGRNPRMLQSGQTPRSTYQSMWATLTSGQPWTGELINHDAHGEVHYEIARIAPLRQADGHTSHYVAVKEDITERKRTELELANYRMHLEELVQQRTADLAHARQLAEASNLAKSEFLATMSHEIRTPMNGVIGCVELLRAASLTPHQMDLAETIRDSALNLLSIIDDVLDFSKIEAGRMELERTSMSPARVAESACDAMLPLALRKGGSLVIFIDPRIPGSILGDAVRLRQIITNLLSNAIKFSSNPEQPALVRLDLRPHATNQLKLTVTDNGIGIDPAVQAEIFNPFRQADVSTTRHFGGTGLGLPVCKRLTELMGGTIGVASALGAGAEFTVTLPMEVDPAWTEGAWPTPLANLDVAIVADAALDGENWAIYLRHAGARTHRYSSVEAAQVAWDGHGDTLLLVDEAGRIDRPQSAAARAASMPSVLLGRGRRRQPRLLGPNVVQLDGDVLHYNVLLQATLMATGRAPQATEANWHDETTALDGGQGESSAVDTPRILVAEDHEINRKVIAQQLARLRYAADVAVDGRQALARWRSGNYALLLTDLHMPNMDGYDLAEAIRREETGGTRRPIIALTANALKSEQQRCLSVGMDEYLIKPVLIDVLKTTLSKWMPAPASSAPVGHAAARTPIDPAVLDLSVLAQVLGTEAPSTIAEFLHEFWRSAQTTGDALRLGCKQEDWSAAMGAAHKLKSAARAVGAMALGNCCADIEEAAKARSTESLLAHLSVFEGRYTAVQTELARHLPTGLAP